MKWTVKHNDEVLDEDIEADSCISFGSNDSMGHFDGMVVLSQKPSHICTVLLTNAQRWIEICFMSRCYANEGDGVWISDASVVRRIFEQIFGKDNQEEKMVKGEMQWT
jgi:hypothetical protein